MRVFLMGCAMALSAAQAASAATFTIFTDRGSFDAAVSSITTEDFNGVVGEPSFNGADLSVGDLGLRNDTLDGRGFIDQAPAQYGALFIDGTPMANIFTGPGADFSLSFGSSITAFGADFGGMNDGFQRGVFSVLGMDIFAPVQAVDTVQFFGIVSDTAFEGLTIGSVRGQDDGFSMDNVSYGIAAVVTSVPLPVTGLLLLGALGGLMGARRRV